MSAVARLARRIVAALAGRADAGTMAERGMREGSWWQ